jgi:hypothetical protein
MINPLCWSQEIYLALQKDQFVNQPTYRDVIDFLYGVVNRKRIYFCNVATIGLFMLMAFAKLEI